MHNLAGPLHPTWGTEKEKMAVSLELQPRFHSQNKPLCTGPTMRGKCFQSDYAPLLVEAGRNLWADLRSTARGGQEKWAESGDFLTCGGVNSTFIPPIVSPFSDLGDSDYCSL